jgi:hypothetical protein
MYLFLKGGKALAWFQMGQKEMGEDYLKQPGREYLMDEERGGKPLLVFRCF